MFREPPSCPATNFALTKGVIVHKLALKIWLPIGTKQCGKNCPWNSGSFTYSIVCPLFDTVLNAGKDRNAYQKDAMKNLGEQDGKMYRCHACQEAELNW
jgi:Fe-S-cluster-containing dehydrogenase component